MKKISLSRFDIGVIIAFVVITLLGGGACYYLSGVLDATKEDVGAAKSDFDKYTTKQPFLPTTQNEQVMKANADLMQAEIDPIIQTKLQATGNKLSTVVKEDTVAWKHDLDAEVNGLNRLARQHQVIVPDNFYYGFSRYLNTNPGDEQTIVLSKQLLGVEEIASIFINANVKSIATFRRTYEEDVNGGGAKGDPDGLAGTAVTAPGNTYIAYPFEIEFDASPTSFRKVANDLEKSPYVFIIRDITLENSTTTSPQISDLQKLSGSNPGGGGGILDTAPGAVTSQRTTKGPQYIFGKEFLHLKIRLDMIEWKGMADFSQDANSGPGSRRRP